VGKKGDAMSNLNPHRGFKRASMATAARVQRILEHDSEAFAADDDELELWIGTPGDAPDATEDGR